MKSIFHAAVVASAVAIPAATFAQQAPTEITRAEVRAELAELRQAGYNPNDWILYPDNFQAAMRRVQALRAAKASAPSAQR